MLDNYKMNDPYQSIASYPFVGLATFAGYPHWNPEVKTDAVILGVPYDEGCSNKPGTRFGPRSIRQASMIYSYDAPEDRYYDADREKWLLQGRTIADAGDVNIKPLSLEQNLDAVTAAVRTILARGAVPVILGGDHSMTYPVLRAFGGRKRKVHYLHLDTHADCDRETESTYYHGDPVTHIFNNGLIASLTYIGVRGLTNIGPDIDWIKEQGGHVFTPRKLRANGVESLTERLPEGEDIYISLDIDFFDPSVAPGTGTPEPGGLFFPEFSDIVQLVGERMNIVGFDVMEVNPMVDNPGEVTSQLASRCVIEMLSAALD